MSESEYKDPEWENSLELKKALKLVLKYEIHCLLRRLSETGEESVVITASAAEGLASHLCSKKGEDFLQIESLDVVKHNFLSYCKVASEPSLNKKSSLENFMSQSQAAPKEQFEISPKEHSSEEITIIEPVSIKSEPVDIDLDLDLQASELTECPQPQEQKTIPSVGRESSQAHRGRKKESSCMPFLREDSKDHFSSDVPEIGERLFENVQYCVYKNHTGKKFDSDFKLCSGSIESTRLEVLSLVNDQSQETMHNSLTDGHFSSSLTGPVKPYGRPIHNAVDEVECHYVSTIRDEEFESKGQSASDNPETVCTAVMMDGLTAHGMNPIHVAPESSTDLGQSDLRDRGLRISFPVDGNANTPPWRPSISASLGTERNHRPKSLISYRQTEDTQSAYKYMCQICGKGSNTRFAHHRHLQCHSGQRPYVCTICGRGLSDKRSYSDHIQMHSGIRPYRCDLCHKSFKHYTTFNTHMRKIHKLRSKS